MCEVHLQGVSSDHQVASITLPCSQLLYPSSIAGEHFEEDYKRVSSTSVAMRDCFTFIRPGWRSKQSLSSEGFSHVTRRDRPLPSGFCDLCTSCRLDPTRSQSKAICCAGKQGSASFFCFKLLQNLFPPRFPASLWRSWSFYSTYCHPNGRVKQHILGSVTRDPISW